MKKETSDKEQKLYAVPENLFDAVVGAVSSLPYDKVYRIIAALSQVPTIEPETKKIIIKE